MLEKSKPSPLFVDLTNILIHWGSLLLFDFKKLIGGNFS